MSLVRYHAKRDFNKTPEPAGRAQARGKALRFVIQKHAASRLHYDFRLELDGTLKSWAVPKGPSLDPADKRLAVHVEDHPIEYGGFEGVIPEKQYGAGEVIVWDRGTWAPINGDARKGYREGHLKFNMDGEKMHGDWALVRMKGGRFGKDDHDNWLLIKEQDGEARPGEGEVLVKDHPESVISGREVEELKGKARVDVWDSNESDPKKAFKPAAGRKVVKKAAVKKAPANRSATKTVVAKKSSRTTRTKAAPEETEPANTGRKAALPATLEPQLATLVETAPQDEGWIYEIKLDGYRLTARIHRGKVTMITRNGHDWSAKFADIVAAIEGLGLQSGWLDGEVCVMNDKGVSSFGLLQQWLSDEGEGAKRDAVYMVFDMPYCEGRDLRQVPLHQRKELLAAVLARADAQGPVRLSEHLDADGSNAQAQACKLGLEGLIGKRLEGSYINGRSRDWIKLKCRQRQEFVVVGYTPPQGSRSGFGSLLLGVHGEGKMRGKLRYAGRVGTGFNQNALSDMLKRMKALATDKSPFDTALPAAARVRGTQWIKPRLVAEITFAEWTGDGIVRQGAFEGLREDKPAKNIGAELPADAGAKKATAKKIRAVKASAATVARVRKIKDDTAAPVKTTRAAAKGAATRSATMKSSSPAGRSDSVRATTSKATSKAPAKAPSAKAAPMKAAPAKAAPMKAAPVKAAPAKAPAAKAGANTVAGVAISHPDRIVFPADGVTKLDVARFYERVAAQLLPYIVDRPMSLVRCPGGIGEACFFQKHAAEMKAPGIERPMIEDTHGINPYIVVNSQEGLVGLAQWGNLELHAWNATMADIEKPDMLVIDFDPADDVPWKQIVEAAQAARTLFDALGLQSFVKTTGGHGLHVVVPFKPEQGWDDIKDFCHHIALRLVEAFPDRFLATATKAKRKGKIFVDYLRNGRGATAVSPYTLRARPGATVAVPLSWDDLKRDWRAKPVTLKDFMTVKGRITDPWKDYFKVQKKQAITGKMKRSVGMA